MTKTKLDQTFLPASQFLIRSSHLEVFCKKGVLRNFAKFTGKNLCQSLFFNKVAGLRPQVRNFIKKETPVQVLFSEICKISKNSFLYRTPVLIYVREDISSKVLEHQKLPHVIERICLNYIWEKKWLLFGFYHAPSQSDKSFFHRVKKCLDMSSKCYERYMLRGDFNVEKLEPCLSTCYKSF